MVSALMFSFSIHFEFIFVHGVRECSNFIHLHGDAQFPAPSIEETIFRPLYILFFFFFLPFRASLAAYGDSQARLGVELEL